METEKNKTFMCWMFNMNVNATNHSTIQKKSDTDWHILRTIKNYNQKEHI